MTTDQTTDERHCGLFFRKAMKMSGEFRIDKPGVYRDRYGRRVQIWCNPGCTDTRYQWISIGDYCGFTYSDDGRREYGMRTSGDIIAYIGPLPAEILQRMAEELALAEEMADDQ